MKKIEYKKCKCGQHLLWYEVEGGYCFDCKSKMLGISKDILLQGVLNK